VIGVGGKGQGHRAKWHHHRLVSPCPPMDPTVDGLVGAKGRGADLAANEGLNQLVCSHPPGVSTQDPIGSTSRP
jgi:hypothetical protein